MTEQLSTQCCQNLDDGHYTRNGGAAGRLCLPPGETTKGMAGPHSHSEMQGMPTMARNALAALASEAVCYLPFYPPTSHKGIWNSTQKCLICFWRESVSCLCDKLIQSSGSFI